VGTPVSAAAALVLRDRTNADPHQVVALALDELVAEGVWTPGRAWRRLRRVPTLRPVTDAPGAKPLRTLDALLRRAVADLDAPLDVAAAGAWCAVHAEASVEGVARRTIEDLLARTLLVREERRLRVTTAGERLIATSAPPPAVHASARDDATRAAALRTFSPPARAFLKAYRNALGGRFPPGSVGSRIAATVPPAGDNRRSAVWTGTLTGRG
jgi:hypothetical protein